MLALALLACANPDGLDSADLAAWRCPEGMVPVGDAEDPAFCIDAYEGVYEGELGSADQGAPDAEPAQATARSAEAGELPALAVSFDQARAICANTPVFDDSGAVIGQKRLVSSQEWQDAGDGQLGDGGLRYPYGDTWDDAACVTWDPSAPVDAPQPAGSRATCVSPFGVYDLIGNLWEWADPGQDIDVAAALQHGAALGLSLGDTDQLLLSGALGGQVRLDVAGVDPLLLTQEPDGQLIVSEVRPESWQWALTPATGFLVLREAQVEQEAERWLPVLVEPFGEVPGPANIRLNGSDDGTALTDKRGCAHYAGTAEGCALDAPYHGHVHDFDGSIGFRCAADPL